MELGRLVVRSMLLSLLTKPWSQIIHKSHLTCVSCGNVNVWATNEKDEPICEGCANGPTIFGGMSYELKTYYSKQLLSRLIPALGGELCGCTSCKGLCLNPAWASDCNGKVWCEECANQCK